MGGGCFRRVSAATPECEKTWLTAVDLFDAVRSHSERRDRPVARTQGAPDSSVHAHFADGEESPLVTWEEMEWRMKKEGEFEADVRASNTGQFSARLHEPGTATVVREVDGRRSPAMMPSTAANGDGFRS